MASGPGRRPGAGDHVATLKPPERLELLLGGLNFLGGLADIGEMGLGGLGGGGTVPGRDRGVDGAMLLQQQIAHLGPGVEPGAVLKHLGAQQRRERSHHVQEHEIVRRLVDRHMQLEIRLCLLGDIAGGVGAVDACDAGGEDLEIHLIGPLRRHTRGGAFDKSAKFQVVVDHPFAGEEQRNERVGDAGAERGDDGAAAGLGRDQPLVLKEL